MLRCSASPYPEVRFRPRALPDDRFHPLLYLRNFWLSTLNARFGQNHDRHPVSATVRIGILVRMRNVAGKREHFTCAELEAIAGDENRDLSAKAREKLSRSRQVRRSAHRAARPQIHHG